MSEKKYILSADAAEKKLRRMALEIAERNYKEEQLILIGIKENGLLVAHHLKRWLADVFKGEVLVVELMLDKKKPAAVIISPKPDLNEKVIVLVDDVANSGRTMLYALKPLLDAYPARIQTAALVERSHKTFPVKVDYVGLSVSTTPAEHIYVEIIGENVTGAWLQ